MSETFRLARPKELPEIARLARHSFIGRSQAEAEAMLGAGAHGGTEALWVGEEAETIVAACHLLSLRQWIGGHLLPVMGLAAVAVAPTHRRRGLAGRLVTAGLRHARERGDLGSALYPFRVRFYEQLGYGLAGEAHQFRLPPPAFPDAPERAGVRLVESDADHQAVREVYSTWSRGQNGQLERTPRSWEEVWEGERAGVLYRDSTGRAEAYAVVRYRSDLPPAERFLEVEERAWLSPTGQRAIYAWLASLGDQWREILYRAHPEEGFAERIAEPRLPLGSAPSWQLWFPAATLLRGPMFRLLDLAAWSGRPVDPEETLTVRVRVIDDQLPENSGAWRLRMTNGAVEVEQGAGASADMTCSLDISTLSRLFIGDLSPSAALAAGRIETDARQLLPRLNRALHARRPWTFDRF